MPDASVTRDGRRFILRPYEPRDRSRVRYICCETGFVGQPQERVFDDRELFADIFSSYWTEYEPENAFVTEVEGVVEGYILGCLDTRLQERVFHEKILPQIYRRAWKRGWLKSAKNRRYLYAMLKSRLRGEFKIPMDRVLKDYPAHLHTNIADPTLRGQGIGKAMMLALFDHLRGRGVPGLHLGTTTHNREAVPFYKHLGFQVMIERRVTFYDHAIPDPPLRLLIFSRRLD
jgi:ribosomal protein S18 acetylase RimI-like enzyme